MIEFDPEIYCPYPCYPTQKVIMQEIYTALITERIYLLEGACGTGKTLSALIPAISVGKSLKKLVVIVTNVNEQKHQFITEAKSIREKAEINILVMSSKLKICYHNNLPEWELDEKTDYDICKKRIESGTCEPYNNIKGLPTGKKPADKEAAVALRLSFEDWLYKSVRSPEEIIQWGLDHTACAYSLCWGAMADADVVICDLRIVLDAQFMLIFQLKTGATLQDMILIFDEAHNIEKAAKDIYEKHLSERRIVSGIGEIEMILDEMKKRRDAYSRGGMFDSVIDEELLKQFGFNEQALKESQTFLRAVLLNSLMKLKVSDLDRTKVTENYDNSLISIADPALPFNERQDDFTVNIMKNGDKEYILKEINKILMIGTVFETMKEQKAKEKAPDDPELMVVSSCKTIASFVSTYLDVQTKNGYYPYLSIKKQENGVIRRRLNIHLSLPDIVTAPVLNNVFAAVLMSATLAPFDILKDVLGIQRDTVEHLVGLQFPLKNRRTYVVTRDAKYDYLAGEDFKTEAPDRLVSANDKNPASIKYVLDSLEAVINGADSNVLIFFKTKTQAEQYFDLLLPKYGSRLLLNMDSNSSHESKDIFYGMGTEGRRGILCTYIGGSLTEGVDFKDDRARVVVIVGIGYFYRSILILADETAYQVEFDTNIGWNLVVQIPTIHKIRQALGRVIRSNKDYGIRILLDTRYSKNTAPTVFKLFPTEERREFAQVNTKYLKDLVIKDFKSFHNSPEK